MVLNVRCRNSFREQYLRKRFVPAVLVKVGDFSPLSVKRHCLKITYYIINFPIRGEYSGFLHQLQLASHELASIWQLIGRKVKLKKFKRHYGYIAVLPLEPSVYWILYIKKKLPFLSGVCVVCANRIRMSFLCLN